MGNSEDNTAADPLQGVAASDPRVNLCTSNDDCSDENQYCSVENGVCLRIGDCDSNADCFDDNNQPYAVALCIGTLECQQGICSMNCGAHHDNNSDDDSDKKDSHASHDHASHDHDSSDDSNNNTAAAIPIAIEPETETVSFEAAVEEDNNSSGATSVASASTFTIVFAASSLLLIA